MEILTNKYKKHAGVDQFGTPSGDKPNIQIDGIEYTDDRSVWRNAFQGAGKTSMNVGARVSQERWDSIFKKKNKDGEEAKQD